MAAPMLELVAVQKRFGGLVAVQGVSLKVEERQIFGLIGPNGAGKTTLFNCITGHYRPEAGDIRFQGESLVGKRPFQIARAGVARTFQNVRLFADMSVLHNVMVAAHHQRTTGVLGAMFRTRAYAEDERVLQRRAEELLDVFELRPQALENAGSLSYGAQRRLEIARALVLKPKLLLLDEPAAGLNSAEADKLKQQIKWLRDKFSLSVMLVEHNMQVVMGACESILCMDHGETIAEGTPREIRESKAVLAAYLGDDALASRSEAT
jgi:branched-chain amino acid transport system ATP-binding protein